MRSMSMLVLGALLASASPAHADQCAKNPRSVAEQAAALVTKGSAVLRFCEPCGDVTPGTSYLVQSVAVRDGELLVNGLPVDLAYLFVRTGPGELVNVGVKSGCGASDVSEAIRAGKPTGPVSARAPVGPGYRVPPPPSPRAASAADLAGTWKVKLTTRYSSCPAMALPAVSEWTITYDQGRLDLTSDAGAELSGRVDSTGSSSLFRATLRPKQRPSGSSLKLTMFLKDRLYGQLLHAERTSKSTDPICLIHQDMQATRI